MLSAMSTMLEKIPMEILWACIVKKENQAASEDVAWLNA